MGEFRTVKLKNEYIRLSKKNDKQKNNEYYNCEDKELGFNLIKEYNKTNYN